MATADLSRLIVPARSRSIPLVRAHARVVAQESGFDSSACRAIELGTEEAVAQFIGLADDETATLELACESEATRLILRLRHHGSPLDCSRWPEYDPSQPETHLDGLSAYLMRRAFDEARWRNLGKEGQEWQLIKYLATPRVGAEPPLVAPAAPAATPAFAIRRLQADDALAVSRCIHACYGYSYVYDFVYYPDRLAAMNASGELISAVAVAADGEVLGHAALIRSDPTARTGELGVAAVSPRYRSGGVAHQLSAWLLDWAARQGWHGVNANAVTSHPFSQHLCARLDFRPCGLLLGLAPASLSFHGIADRLRQRESCVLAYRALQPAPARTLYPPLRYQNLLTRIYGRLDRPVSFAPGQAPAAATSRWETTAKAHLGTAILTLHQSGRDAARVVAGQLLELRRQGMECVLLYLNLSDPALPDFAPDWERLGFHFAGVLPGGDEGDWLILNHPLQQAFDYERLVLADDWSRELLAAIEAEDPVLQALAGRG
ncbi:MAG: GNAT family N-acetyltransferase [Candidatus Contendobacter sp.]|nr:GNAT family N-acetyltransferase [Candidatus Contendobacter sp.]MDS4057032.1 GNAT family N-acetyltransferase [Candidatus Contendobacter sp.]